MSHLYAISDLHLEHRENQAALKTIGHHPDDWLILAGDITTHPDQLDRTLSYLSGRFARVIWTPGNHEFWGNGCSTPGPQLYKDYVGVCRAHGCLTPEDPFARWPDADGDYIIAPIFAFYDYSFAPDEVATSNAVSWAMQHGAHCMDEVRIDPAPFPDFPSWCAHRVRHTRSLLNDTINQDSGLKTVLVSHFPLRSDWIRLKQYPAFVVWCGTRQTENWPREYNAEICVHGHLHMRGQRKAHGVRVEDVSLGYPGQWNPRFGMNAYLREVLRAPIAVNGRGA